MLLQCLKRSEDEATMMGGWKYEHSLSAVRFKI